jgi:hypothetical protein
MPFTVASTVPISCFGAALVLSAPPLEAPPSQPRREVEKSAARSATEERRMEETSELKLLPLTAARSRW